MTRFAVIGHPVAHSLSPRLHAANFRALGFDGMYEAVDVAPEDLAATLTRFRREGFRGINVTVPHKVSVAALVTRLDATARAVGAVNTVRFEADGTTTGFNTDVAGFRAPLVEAGFALAGACVFLLGAGGAARAVAHACLAAGCASLTLANRTLDKAEALAAELAAAYPQSAIRPFALSDLATFRPGPSSLFVNATSIGLKAEDPSVLPAAFARPDVFVYDIIPCARETATLAAARAAGARTLGGLGMLAAQAAESFRLWTGRAADLAAMRHALEGRTR